MMALGGNDDDFEPTIFASEMTLRDHFAGLALQGMLANSQQQEYFDDNLTYLAYSLADSMMKARNNHG